MKLFINKRKLFMLFTSLVVSTTLLFSNGIVMKQQDTTLKKTMPKAGRLVHDKPAGKGWINLLSSADDWNYEEMFWQLNKNLMHGSIGKEKEHHYSYTKKKDSDFELNVMKIR